MLSSIITSLESFIINNGAWAVFLGCILEQIIVPIPASLIVISSSIIILKGVSPSISSLGVLLIKIVIPASLGTTIGSLFYYYLAYKLEKPFIERTGKYLGVSLEDVADVEKRFKESHFDDLSIFLARCIPIIPSIAINLFCGLIRYDLKMYLITTFFGSLVQIFAWGLLAWIFGNIYQALEDEVAMLGNIVTLIIIIVVLCYVIKKRREK
ncbi:MAG: VTT domain-containing protein [Methanobacteriaceae archaeon]|nr:VTT domain-containing protein [Methanobacteriaceae archaeon]